MTRRPARARAWSWFRGATGTAANALSEFQAMVTEMDTAGIGVMVLLSAATRRRRARKAEDGDEGA